MEFPGLIIPALPEKQLLGTFEQQFIESRKRGLQKFVTTGCVSCHTGNLLGGIGASSTERDHLIAHRKAAGGKVVPAVLTCLALGFSLGVGACSLYHDGCTKDNDDKDDRPREEPERESA